TNHPPPTTGWFFLVWWVCFWLFGWCVFCCWVLGGGLCWGGVGVRLGVGGGWAGLGEIGVCLFWGCLGCWGVLWVFVVGLGCCWCWGWGLLWCGFGLGVGCVGLLVLGLVGLLFLLGWGVFFCWFVFFWLVVLFCVCCVLCCFLCVCLLELLRGWGLLCRVWWCCGLWAV
ncbi:hypothetical protein RA269_27735, partial [Pseudomonas syringae pv. tagetis]|uniref:hypothetical protein n=1 Tax=Pseudomonas syringae group genomosp. 7 TaxID=251699 RepID=UPI0037703F18